MLEGLDYNDDLTDKSSKNYLDASQGIENAVSFLLFLIIRYCYKLFKDKPIIRLIKIAHIHPIILPQTQIVQSKSSFYHVKMCRTRISHRSTSWKCDKMWKSPSIFTVSAVSKSLEITMFPTWLSVHPFTATDFAKASQILRPL